MTKNILGWGVVLVLCTQAHLSTLEIILLIMVCVAIQAIPERKERDANGRGQAVDQ